MDKDQLIAALAKILAGLQCSFVISGEMTLLGTAAESCRDILRDVPRSDGSTEEAMKEYLESRL